MSALFDFSSLIIVILLFISLVTHTKSLYPTIFNDAEGVEHPHSGLKGICWKFSRVGERCSPYIGGACIIMAIHLLFIRV